MEFQLAAVSPCGLAFVQWDDGGFLFTVYQLLENLSEVPVDVNRIRNKTTEWSDSMIMTKEMKRVRIGISSFVLHIIAMSLMLCDHLWGSFLANFAWLGYLGRIAFPIFAFMLVEGFVHTGSRKKYALRMLVFALISEIPFNLLMEHRVFNPFHQNVLWTFLIGIGMMSLYEKIKMHKHLPVRFLLYVLVTFAGYFCGFIGFVDYFGYGILMVALFYFTRTESTMMLWQRMVVWVIQAAAMYWINCEMMMGMMIPITVFGLSFEVYKQGFAMLALPVIWLYNGKQGAYNKTIKNVYYWFYPVHLLILGVLMTVL